MIAALLLAGAQVDGTLTRDGDLRVVETWDTPRPERVLDLAGLAGIDVEGDRAARAVRVPAGDGPLEYTLHGVATVSGDSIVVAWTLWSASQPGGVDSLRTTLSFEFDAEPTVQIMSGARANRWSREGARLVFEFNDVPEGALVRVLVTLSADAMTTGVRPMQWLKTGGANLVMFGLPLAALILTLLVYIFRGRDPRGDPGLVGDADALPPAILGVVIDETAGSHEVVATWIDLAARGVKLPGDAPADALVFERCAAEAFADASKLSAAVDAVYEDACRRGLFLRHPAVERRVASAIGGLIAAVGFAFLIPAVSGSPAVSPVILAMLSSVVFLGVSLASRSVRISWPCAAGAAAAAILGISMVEPSFTAYARLAVGLITAGGIVTAMAPMMPARTPKGAEWRARAVRILRAIQEGPIDAATAQETFERMLPFAVALREKKRWVNRFDGLPIRAPAWWRDAPLADVKEEFLGFLGGWSRRAAGAGMPGGG